MMKMKNNNEDKKEEFIPFSEAEPPVILGEQPVMENKIASEPEVKKEELPIRRGSTIKFTGTKSYSGLNITQYQDKICKVKEISGDRVVIADGANVIAAVNIKDCVKV